MDFKVRITLPESPETNLAERLSPFAFSTSFRTPIPPETEEDLVRSDFAKQLISEGIILEEREKDLIFDFE